MGEVNELPAGFKMTELGRLPEEWEITQLDEVARIVMGQSPPSSTYNTDGSGLPFLQGKAEFGEVYPRPSKYCSAPKKVAPKGAVLVSVRAPVGDVNIAPVECCIGRGLAALEPEIVDGYFLFYYLRSAVERLKERGTGTTFKSINKGVLQTLGVPMPPVPEQRAIAEVLSAVRRAIDATEAVLEAAQALKKSLMQHLFTYGPVPVDQAERVPLRTTEFGKAPRVWAVMPLVQCVHVQTGVAKGRKLETARTIEVPYLRVANVQDGYLDLSEIKFIHIKEQELARYRLQDGDVVLTEGGDFDKLGRGFVWRGEIATCVHQNHIFAVRANRDMLLPEYLAYLVQSNYGKSYFLKVAHRTTNLASINSTKLKAFPALVPDHESQKEMAGMLSCMDNKIHSETQQKAALEALFRSLLHHLMTGQVRVPIP